MWLIFIEMNDEEWFVECSDDEKYEIDNKVNISIIILYIKIRLIFSCNLL